MNDMPRSSNGDVQVAGSADRFLEQLAERLGGKATVTVVYGAPVERDGVTVIPVARVRWGFGGGAGSGSSQAGPGSGQGGGGGVSAAPVGYIEIANGGTQFKRIHDPIHLLVLVPLILATGVSVGIVLRGVQRLMQPRPRGPIFGARRPSPMRGGFLGRRSLARRLG